MQQINYWILPNLEKIIKMFYLVLHTYTHLQKYEHLLFRSEKHTGLYLSVIKNVFKRQLHRHNILVFTLFLLPHWFFTHKKVPPTLTPDWLLLFLAPPISFPWWLDTVHIGVRRLDNEPDVIPFNSYMIHLSPPWRKRLKSMMLWSSVGRIVSVLLGHLTVT